MKTYTEEELNEILRNHKHWILEDVDGWEEMRADLRGVNFQGANLRGADLCEAELCGANLQGANLQRADLYGANLYEADLCGTNLYEADLCGVDLCGTNLYEADLCGTNLYEANLYGANLCGANLREADLCEVDLRRANLCGANLRGADLYGADLRGANLYGTDLRGANNIPFVPMDCPDTGPFVAWKKANRHIVKLEIPADARRSSATGRKCRCDKAKVIEIQELDGSPSELTEVASGYDPNFVYRVGEIAEEPIYDENRWEECAPGIHFFINRQEAVDYNG